MSRIVNLLRSEPVAVSGIVTAVIGLLTAFGVNISTTQAGAILTVIGAVLAIGVRRTVTPNAKLVAPPPPDH